MSPEHLPSPRGAELAVGLRGVGGAREPAPPSSAPRSMRSRRVRRTCRTTPSRGRGADHRPLRAASSAPADWRELAVGGVACPAGPSGAHQLQNVGESRRGDHRELQGRCRLPRLSGLQQAAGDLSGEFGSEEFTSLVSTEPELGYFDGDRPEEPDAEDPVSDELRRTPLYDAHVAAGARLVPFAGWEMPVQYEGVKEEHLAVRSGAGVFDVSHMGEIGTEGPQALEFLQRLVSNDVAKLAPAAPSTRASARRTAASSTTSSPTASARPLPDRLQRRQPRGRLRPLPRGRRRLRRRGHRPRRRVRDARRPGPGGARDRRRARRRRRAAAADEGAMPSRSPACRLHGLRHRLHGRVRGRAAVRRPRGGPRCGSAARGRRHARGARRPRHAAARGLLPPARQRRSARSATRSRPGSAGAARRRPASSAPRRSPPPAAGHGREARRRWS